MALVVEPTNPYSSKQLQIEDPKRWSRLFPLMRPSIKAVETSNGHAVIVDTALVSSKDVLLAAVGSVGNFSSKILSESHLAAFTVEQSEGSGVTGKEIASILQENGFATERGLVVVRAGSKQSLNVGDGLLELVIVGELQVDHVLSLLTAVEPEVL